MKQYIAAIIFTFSLGCEKSQLNQREGFSDVQVTTENGGLFRVERVIMESESETVDIETQAGSIHVDSEVFDTPVISIIEELPSGQGVHLEIVNIGGLREAAQPKKAFQVCLPHENPHTVDITITPTTDNVEIHDGIAKTSELCVETNVVSGTFETTLETKQKADDATITEIEHSVPQDNKPPTETIISIHAGATHTNSTATILTLAATDADEMFITNTADCSTNGTWEAYNTTKNWTLGQTNANATVYIKFRDLAGNESTCINDTITHDSQEPVSSSISINAGASHTNSVSATLSLGSTGANEMFITNTADCSTNGTWEAYNTTKNWTIGQTNANATVYVKFRDLAGNESTCINDTITHDDQGPTSSSVSIDAGAANTNSNTVTLALAATDADEMFITNTASCAANGTWETYNTTKNWTLGQTNANATVYVKYRDVLDNESACVSDIIIHDDQDPTAPTAFNDGTSSGATTTPTLSWVASADTGTGVSFYEISVGTSAGLTDIQNWTNVGDLVSASISGLTLNVGTTYYANIRAVDAAGNTSPIVNGDGFLIQPQLTNATSYGNHMCGQFDNGTIKCWGNNYTGQLGQGHDDDLGDGASEMGNALNNVDLGTNRTVIKVSAGGYHTCANLDDATTKCWGSNYQGQIGHGAEFSQGDHNNEMGDDLAALDMGTNRTAVTTSSADRHSCALLDNGDIKCWGMGQYGRLGYGNENDVGDESNEMGDNLSAIDLGTSRTGQSISLGGSFTCAILDNQATKCWGRNNYGQLGQEHYNALGDNASEMGDNLAAIDLGTSRTATQIAAGSQHVCALLDNGQVKCWGFNGYGQLGIGHSVEIGGDANDMGDNLSAINLGTNRTATQIVAGENHNCALLDDSTMKCWGSNTYGQLGIGNASSQGNSSGEMGDNLAAIDLGTNRTATKIIAGDEHSCAILDNHTLKCWGKNEDGQLGQGHVNALGDDANEMGDNLPVISLQ